MQRKQCITYMHDVFCIIKAIAAKRNLEIFYLKFPLTQMGFLAPGSAHARPSAQPPIDVSGNFPAHVSAESLFLNFPILGGRGVHRKKISIGILIFMLLWSPCKIWEPYDNSFLEI
jgi:hypothetical protein